MTSEGLGEVFKGDSADTCAGKFPLVSMGGRTNGQACADVERGPPSARAELLPSFGFSRPAHGLLVVNQSLIRVFSHLFNPLHRQVC